MTENTGFKVYTKLLEKIVGTSTFTGQEKPNVDTDPDYVPPVQDLTSCPIPVHNPNVFNFTDLTNQNLATLLTSNQLTITGLTVGATIVINNGGQYSINGGAWTSAIGIINNNNQLRLRNTSPSTYGTNKNTVVTIGSVSDTWVIGTKLETAWRVLSTSGYCIDISGSNTGYKAFTTLEQYYIGTGNPTGAQKSNVDTDPDYIAPIVNLDECPVTQPIANVQLSVYGANPQIGAYNAYGFKLTSNMNLDEDVTVNFSGYYEGNPSGMIPYSASLTLYRNTLEADSTLIITNSSPAGSDPSANIDSSSPTNGSTIISTDTGGEVTLNIS